MGYAEVVMPRGRVFPEHSPTALYFVGLAFVLGMMNAAREIELNS